MRQCRRHRLPLCYSCPEKVFSKDLTGFRRVLVNQAGFYAQIIRLIRA
jgi:hypothetical protein